MTTTNTSAYITSVRAGIYDRAFSGLLAIKHGPKDLTNILKFTNLSLRNVIFSMKSEILSRVYDHPLIRPIELTRIIDAHQKVTFQKGEFILRQGDQAQCYLIMEEGLMRSFIYDMNGIDITTDFFCNHDIIIEVLSLFQRIPTSENIQALKDSNCWQIEYDVFQELFHTIDGFAEWGRLWMSNSLFQFKQRSLDMVTLSAKDRYLQLIREKPQVVLHAPLKYIASYLGITDTSFSRIRREIS